MGVDADLGTWPEDPSWSRIASRPGLPFRSRTLRGVGIDGRLGERSVQEAARIVAPMSRVVVTNAPPETAGWLELAGLQLMVSEAQTVVAARG